MINPDLIFRIANIFFLIGTIILIYAIVKNRNVLKGFQPIGSSLTLVAMSFIQFNYYQMGWWENFWLSLPTWGLWFLASVFSMRTTIRVWWERRKGRLSVYRMLGCKNKKEFEERCKKFNVASPISPKLNIKLPTEEEFNKMLKEMIKEK